MGNTIEQHRCMKYFCFSSKFVLLQHLFCSSNTSISISCCMSNSYRLCPTPITWNITVHRLQEWLDDFHWVVVEMHGNCSNKLHHLNDFVKNNKVAQYFSRDVFSRLYCLFYCSILLIIPFGNSWTFVQLS